MNYDKKICVSCGRMFTARKPGQSFCSMACKKRYTYRRQFKCSECRATDCKARNNYSLTVPNGCQNFGWEPPLR